ncbi:hypothetical protein DVH24_010921 [Malus domestica]|uniref:Uncharacterized protein n=1 Tax=Malus domestica TaxID=3750 RepID=A0A498JU73_MALDO|nr:hypothetical protein DVH24_010921 [Malus domestica]
MYTFDAWFLAISSMAGDSKMDRDYIVTLISYICWEIWKARCCAIFNGTCPSPLDTARRAAEAISEFLSISKVLHVSSINGDIPAAPLVRWHAPPLSVVKVNCDAAWSSVLHRMGLGVIIWDYRGSLLVGDSGSGVASSSLDAEAHAAIFAKKTASWCWIPCQANLAADWVAPQSLRGMCPEVWVSRPPSALYSETERANPRTQNTTKKMNSGSIASILVAGSVGVSLNWLGKKIPTLMPKNDIFFLIKAFAAGVILAIGFVHILPDAFDNLTSPCIKENPWGKFPYTGFVTMLSATGTLMVDSLATGYYQRSKVKSNQVTIHELESGDDDHAGHVHGHTHSTQGHAHGSEELKSSELIRQRVISLVLELGILVHSVIIGISLGASPSRETIKPLMAWDLVAASAKVKPQTIKPPKAQFKSRSAAIMATFFSLTTPVGIAVGVGISTVYNMNSPTALIFEGTSNAAAGGILIYMALVDLLAADFMNPRMQGNLKIQLGAYSSLLLGTGCMSLLAKWA